MLLGGLLLTGCTAEAGPDPSATATPQTATGTPVPTDEPTESEAAGVTVEAELQGGAVQIDVSPVQVSGEIALLTFDVALAADAPAPLTLGILLAPVTSPGSAGAVRLVDLDAGTVFPVAVDEAGRSVTSRHTQGLLPGETVRAEAFFAAPAGGTVDVMLPYFGIVEGVPVEAGSGPLPTTPADLGASGGVTGTAVPLDAFLVAYDDSSSSRVTGADVTVTLASDVLFDVDEHVLTPAAQAVVDAAAAEIAQAAASGEVQVIGHTDDVGTDDYNQGLSERRADAVAQRLAPALGGELTVRAEGRGEGEPAVVGTTDEARAANRRVEIRFTAVEPGAAVDVGGDGAEAPEATGPQVAAGEQVTVEPTPGNGFAVSVDSVTRTGEYLVGSLRIEALGDQNNMTELFGTVVQGLSLGRGMSYGTMMYGAQNVTLLGEGSRYYPLDYVRPGGDDTTDLRAALADQNLIAWLDEGQSTLATIVWPDPGGDTVTIDVPDRFRIADVPVG